MMLKSGSGMALPEAPNVVSSVVDSSVEFADPTSNISIVEDETVKEDSPWNVRDLSFKDDRIHSALQRIQDLCRSYAFSVPSNIRSVSEVIKDALDPFTSAGGDKTSAADSKESHAAEKAD